MNLIASAEKSWKTSWTARVLHRPANIGTGKEINIAQLADKIVKEVGYQGKLTFDATKPDGTMRKLTDVSKLHRLGWQHKIDIEEGVHRMYQWYLSKG